MYRYTKGPSLKKAAWRGAAAGVALLAKFSMLLAGHWSRSLVCCYGARKTGQAES
jgi:hypothetical protein